MFSRLVSFSTKYKGSVVVTTILLAALAVGWNASLKAPFSVQTGDNLSSKSVRAANILHEKFHTVQENVILVFTVKSGTIATRNSDGTYTENADVKAAQQKIFDDIANLPRYRESFSFWTLKDSFSKSAFICCDSTKPTQALAFAVVDDTDEKVGREISAILRADASPLFTVQYGGESAIEPEFSSTIKNDIKGSLIWVLPLFLILLVLVFRSVVAALVALLAIVFVISWSLLIMAAVGHYTTISAYIFLLISVLGTCLALYTSLLLIRGFRKERSVDLSTIKAVGVSGLVVLISFLVLLVFPQSFMRSFAIAGVVIALVTLLFSLVAMPGFLASLDQSIDRYPSPRLNFITNVWSKAARLITKAIVLLAILATLLLVIAAVPMHKAHFGIGDQRSLDENATSRQAMDAFRKFAAGQKISTDVVFPNLENPNEKLSRVLEYKDKLMKVKSVQAIVTPERVYFANGTSVDGDASYIDENTVRLQVVGIGDPLGYDAEEFVRAIQNVPAPYPVLIGGASARLTDNKANMRDRLPMALILTLLVLFVSFYLLTRSWLQATANAVLVALPLSATLGIVSWLYRSGNGGAGVIDYNISALLLSVSFALVVAFQTAQTFVRQSREEMILNAGGAVIIPSLLFVVVTLPFVFVHVSFIEMFGVGLIIALALNAFLVRLLIAPALAHKSNA